MTHGFDVIPAQPLEVPVMRIWTMPASAPLIKFDLRASQQQLLASDRWRFDCAVRVTRWRYLRKWVYWCGFPFDGNRQSKRPVDTPWWIVEADRAIGKMIRVTLTPLTGVPIVGLRVSLGSSMSELLAF